MISTPFIRRSLLLLLASVTLIVESPAQSSRRIREHEVKKEETLYSIARRYNSTVDKILELNPWARNQIKPGDHLLIPTEPGQGTPQAESKSHSSATSKVRKHRVQAGETLYQISRTYGLDLVDLLRANPGVTSSTLQAGQELNIPEPGDSLRTSRNEASPSKPDSQRKPITPVPEPKDEPQDNQSSVSVAGQTRVLVMLPLSRRERRYTEFYEGFLLGMYELKKAGVSIQLTTLDTPDDESVMDYISSGQLQHQDLVFGGITEAQIRALAKASGYSSYIVPFSKVSSLETGLGAVVLPNAPTEEVTTEVIPQFLRRYAGKSVVFVSRTGDEEDSFATQLRRALGSAGVSYSSIQLGQGAVSIPSGSVVVPVSPDRNLALATLTALRGRGSSVALFGYPQWQSYGSDFQRRMRQLSTTIFTSFFFDPTQRDSHTFLTQYTQWFGHRLSNSYPKYSVLGYDLARYFIRAYATYGRGYLVSAASQATPGLQLDMQLRRTKDSGVYLNSSFYFVTFNPSGSITRETH